MRTEIRFPLNIPSILFLVVLLIAILNAKRIAAVMVHWKTSFSRHRRGRVHPERRLGNAQLDVMGPDALEMQSLPLAQALETLQFASTHENPEPAIVIRQHRLQMAQTKDPSYAQKLNAAKYTLLKAQYEG